MKTRAIIQILLLLVCTTLLLHATPAQSQALIDFTVTPAFEGNYVPGTWLSLTLNITNKGPAIKAQISAALPESTERYIQELQLAGAESQRLTLYVPMMQVSHEIHVSIIDGSTTLAEQTIEVRPRTDERMLGIVTSEDLSLNLPRRQDLTRMPFNALQVSPADLPDRAVGLGSLGLLLIDNLTPNSLSPDQINAVLSWVNTGGHLIISGGPNAQSMNEWLPVALQAATVGESQQIDDRALADLVEAAGPGKLAAAQLSPLPGGITAGLAEAPAWVSRSFGKGKVTQLAFDPGLPMLQSWAKAPDFWNAFLQPALQVSTSFGYQTNADIIQEQFLASALTALPTVNQPPVDLFFLILIIYTILIGPVLALGLRRIDRQSWSWLIVPGVAIGSGSLLLTIAINLQADSRMITQINLVEYLGNDQVRARAYVGILAPQQQTLTVNLPTEALTRPVISIKGLFSEIRGISGPIGQEQERLPINVDAWTLEGFVAEHQITLPGIESKIVVNDQGALVELQNGTEQKLSDVVAVYGEQVVWLGDILPGEKVNGHWPPTLNLAPPGTMLSSIIFSDALNAAQLPGQAAERRLKARISMIDAAVVHTATETDPGPMILAWMESSPLNVDVEVPSAARQNLTLLVIHPHITGSGTIDLPQDWLRVDSTNEQQAACFSSEGTGVAASPDPATIMLHVPADLAPLKASKLTLNINSSDTWPNAGVITELYSWKNADWVEQQFDGPGDLKVANPEEYLFQGRVLLRLSGAIPRAKCLYIHTRLQGSLP